MAEKRDYYEVLGVEKNVDDAALKKAYRVFAKKYYPDTNPGDKEACFGLEREIEIPSKIECKTCGRSGAKPGASPITCGQCGGRGQVVHTLQSLFGMVQNVTTCPACGGRGTVIREKCPDCGGNGYTSKKEKL